MDKNRFLKQLKKEQEYGEIKRLVKIGEKQWQMEDNEINYHIMQKAKMLSREFEYQLFYQSIHKDAEKRFLEIMNSSMIAVEEQKFWMGSADNSKMLYCGEQPRHLVCLDAFRISKTLITNEMYSRFVNKNFENGMLPVTNITWFDAYMFCQWLGGRLPTEAEWEMASGRVDEEHWCCKENKLSEFAWYSENSNGIVHPVGQKKPNSLGIYDMHGNVWEWVLDDYNDEYYKKTPVYNPCYLAEGNYKVCRGGSIHAFSEMCRSEFRYYEPPSFSAVDLGFRIVMEEKKNDNSKIS